MDQEGDKCIPTELCTKIFKYVFEGSHAYPGHSQFTGHMQYGPNCDACYTRGSSIEDAIDQVFQGYDYGASDALPTAPSSRPQCASIHTHYAAAGSCKASDRTASSDPLR